MPLFTVIIPTYRRLSSLILCLNCLQPYFDEHKQDELGYEIEAIVTDDAGDLNVRQHIADHFPWCRYVKGPGRGPAANRNHGADVAHGRWLVFVDDDCFPQETFMEAYAQYVSVYKVLEGRTSPFGKRMRADDECPINEQGGCLWSCNFAIRRDLFLELGQFNEAFPTAAMEDVEFYERIKKAHLPVKFVEDAIVYHEFSGSTKKKPTLRFYLSINNYWLNISKTFPLDLLRKNKQLKHERHFEKKIKK
jgi:GT2 family glycosyltransferase